MARPRTDEVDPLRRLLSATGRGEGVEPEHQAHLMAVTRAALAEADELVFGPFERIAGAMVIRLYGRSLASQDAITCARSLGEVVRSLRALRLLSTAGQLRSGQPMRSRRNGPGIFSPSPSRRAAGALHGEEGAPDDERVTDHNEDAAQAATGGDGAT